MNRKERRFYEKEARKKATRKIDWKKVSKLFRQLIVIGLFFSLLVFCFTYYSVNKHNNLRENILANPRNSIGKVTYIAGGKFHFATYEYYVTGKKYENSTFFDYNGNLGNEICIEYSIENPSLSIFCNEKEIESVKEDVVLVSIKTFGLIIIFSLVYIMGSLIFGNRKLMIEITSKN